MTPLAFALVALGLDLASTLVGLRMGGHEANPMARGWTGIGVNAVLLGIMFWQFNVPLAWYGFGAMHLLAAAWNVRQIVKAR